MTDDASRLDFLAVGHVTVDIVPTPESPAGERHYGGAVTYGALTAAALRLRPSIVTSAAEVYPFAEVLPGIAVENVPAANTTTFQNIYQSSERVQVLAARGGEIGFGDIPEGWSRPRIALLGPLAKEFDATACGWFAGSLKGLILQGLLRNWDEYGRVTLAPVKVPSLDEPLDVLIAGNQELSRDEAEDWAAASRVVVRTVGEHGAVMLVDGAWHEVSAPPVVEVDPTGAGDVWAAAYLVRLSETSDPHVSARFASAAASISVTGVGTERIPGRDEVEELVGGSW